jgi:hypothetical protein
MGNMLLNHLGKRPFRYSDKGNVAVVGKNFAVLERGWPHTNGLLTWLVWAFDLVNRVPEVVRGFPDRLGPKNEAAAASLALNHARVSARPTVGFGLRDCKA